MRALFAETALRMFGSAPVTGVGIGQYRVRYLELASPDLFRSVLRGDAHNYFLWLGAELGVIGLASFVWLLGAALAGIWSQVRSPHSARGFLATSVGLAAFVITWLVGQPLAVPQVAYTFWIVVGMASAPSTAIERSSEGDSNRSLSTKLALAAALFVVVSIPIRASRALAEIDLSRVAYGVDNWRTGGDGVRFRWSGPRATFFMRSSVRAIEIPVAANPPSVREGFQIEVAVEGNVASRLTLHDRRWHSVRINAPAARRRFWRIDLRTSPIEGPNRRILRVGEIAVLDELPDQTLVAE